MQTYIWTASGCYSTNPVLLAVQAGGLAEARAAALAVAETMLAANDGEYADDALYTLVSSVKDDAPVVVGVGGAVLAAVNG